MTARISKLTLEKVAELAEKGRRGDGPGLYLQNVTGSNGNKPVGSWILRVKRARHVGGHRNGRPRVVQLGGPSESADRTPHHGSVAGGAA